MTLPITYDLLRQNLYFILPELCLFSTFIFILIIRIIKVKSFISATKIISWVGLFSALIFTLNQLNIVKSSGEIDLFYSSISLSVFSIYIKLIIILGGLFTLLLSFDHNNQGDYEEHLPEFCMLLFLMLAGGFLLPMARNMAMVFLAFEMVSLPGYLLVGFYKKDRQSAESSFKYFIYGSVISAGVLYGMSLLYMKTGSTDLFFLPNSLNPQEIILPWLIIITGAAFKTGLFPFHFWMPEVYKGSPFSVALLLSSVSKTAGLAFLFITVRFCFLYLESETLVLTFITVLSCVSMFYGNLGALKQTHLRGLLAYSGIANTGYLTGLIICSKNENPESVFLYYILFYILSNSTIFILYATMKKKGFDEFLPGWKLNSSGSFFLAGLWTVLMGSLTGLPPFAGFWAKLFLLNSIFNSWNLSHHIEYIILFSSILINTLISLFYYFKIPANLFFGYSNPLPKEKSNYSVLFIASIIACLLLIISGLFYIEQPLAFFSLR